MTAADPEVTTTVSQADFARAVGVHRNIVYKALLSGRLTGAAVTADRRIVLEAALAQWHSRRDPAATFRQSAAPIGPTPVAPAPDKYRDARTRAAELDAELKELELARRRDEYRHRAEIEKSLVTAGRIIRQALDKIPQIAAEMMALAPDEGAARARGRQLVRELEATIADALTGADD